MVLTLMAAPVAAAYQDTEGHWAEASIERWTGHGIVQGTENGFDPDGELTCAQLAAILARLLKLPEAPDAGFSDNPAEAWYYDSVNRCAAAGILLGNGDGTVTPNAPITRERAIVMLSRALGIEPIENPDLSAFEDADAVADYAQGYVAALVEAGVIKGVTDETVGPQLNITRAATVAILDRAIAVYADTDGAEIDASEGGFILVAAENVVIKNAPTGTKVLVPPSADGLTVNGKKVESDQTYVVPENKPVTPTVPTHSHSYDETTHKCSCGSFDPAVVATIGDEVGYLTLKDAVAAAQSGDTVKLVKDIVISPAVSDEDKTVSKLVAQLTVDTDVVLDMNGKKLSVTEGDFGKASPLLIAVTAGTLTIKGNGEINCEAGENQVYGINVNGGKVVVEDGTFYGAMTAIQVQKGELVIKDGTFDMAPTCKAMVPQYAKYIVNAIDSAWKNGTAKISIFGGKFGFDPSNTPEGAESTYLADGYQATETAEGSGFWTVTKEAGVSFAAEVGGVEYTTLAKAVAAAAAGDTVTLVDDVTLDSLLRIEKNITLDLGGKTLEREGSVLDIYGTVTIQNGTIGTTSTGSTSAAWVNGTAKLTVASDVTFTTTKEAFALAFDSSCTAAEVIFRGTITGGNGITMNGLIAESAANILTMDGATIKVTGHGIYQAGCANTAFTIGNSTISGATGIEVRAGELNVTNSVISGSGEFNSEANASGTTTDGAGIAVVQHTTNLPINVTISGGEISGTYAFYQATKQSQNTADSIAKITLSVTGGEFNGTVYSENKTGFITGGTFSSDPSDYVAEGCAATENDDGTWTVA